jgi:hypothetical protein
MFVLRDAEGTPAARKIEPSVAGRRIHYARRHRRISRFACRIHDLRWNDFEARERESDRAVDTARADDAFDAEVCAVIERPPTIRNSPGDMLSTRASA